MTSAALSFSHPVRIYWEDTDAGGVVPARLERFSPSILGALAPTSPKP